MSHEKQKFDTDVMTGESTWSIYSPNVDVYENDSELLLVAQVPGAIAEHTSVRLLDSVLSISADLPVVEGVSASYRRQLLLALPVDPERVSVELRSGELMIRLPKPETHLAKLAGRQAS